MVISDKLTPTRLPIHVLKTSSLVFLHAMVGHKWLNTTSYLNETMNVQVAKIFFIIIYDHLIIIFGLFCVTVVI